MNNAQIIVATVLVTLFSVSILAGAYFLGEAHIAFLIQQIQFAISQETH